MTPSLGKLSPAKEYNLSLASKKESHTTPNMLKLLSLLSFLVITTGLQAIQMIEGTWEIIEGCQLVSAPYNDGDSFQVLCDDEKLVFRLYWVDALETTETYKDRIREQAQYFNISESAVTHAGKLATNFTKNFLRGEFTIITKWEDARGSRSNKRYFAMVQKGGQYLSTELLRQGLARLYGKPTDDRWPSGVRPGAFLGRLKNNERAAQRENDGIWASAKGSLQMDGLEALAAATVSDEPGTLVSQSELGGVPAKERLNVNTATTAELDTLPGIGPALAARIISARPILSAESLVEIPGISENTLSSFRHLIMTEDPPPPPFTIVFYEADLETHLDTQIKVLVESVRSIEAKSPDTFRSVRIETAYRGESGGSIIAFIPDEFYDSFIQYYSEPGREFTGLLYQRDGKNVLVYTRP